MAAIELTVPGLNAPLSPQDYEESRRVYGTLSDDTLLDGSQEVFDKHLSALFEIIKDHNLLKHFGIHSAHTHYALPDGTVQFGIDSESPFYRRTKPVLVESLSNKKVHGHIFVVTSDSSLQAYEFQDGDAPDFSDYDLNPFLREFVEYVNQKRLQALIGLQIRDHKNINRPVTWECFEGEESIMIGESTALGFEWCQRGRTTGWVGRKQDGGHIKVCGKEYHVEYKGQKACFTDQTKQNLFPQ